VAINREVILTLEHVTKSYSDNKLIKDAGFGIHAGERIGLIGVNGCGKTTFLRLLSGQEEADSGRIVFRNNLKLSYLPQTPNLNPHNTILEQLYQANGAVFQLLRDYTDLAAELSIDYSEESLHRQQELSNQIEALQGWQLENKVKSILSKVGFTKMDQTIGTLSGGQKRKVDLARVLIEDPDVLLLDEPTNHLDVDTIEWLQGLLASFKGTILFVTHDRYFLDAVSNRILEIDNGEFQFYEGNYSYYLEKKSIEEVGNQRKEIRRVAQLKKEMKWLQRGAKARATKPKNHVDRVRELIDKSYLTTGKDMDISFQQKRMGKTILELKNLSKAYTNLPLFTDFQHVFQQKERIGIIGANGCGKTTMLRIIVGTEAADSGSVKLGLNTQIAYYQQEQDDLPANLSVIDYIKQYADHIRTEDGVLHSATEMLDRFLFDGKMQQSKIGSLSGGERKRLYMLKSLMFGSNFLLLDEPTNDLDIRTLEVLEDYLDAYKGCLLVVSHDRFFLDRVVDNLFIFEENGIRKFPGTYSDYLLVKRFIEEEAEEVKEALKQQTPTIPKTPTKKLSYKEQRELTDCENNIQRIEAELSVLQDKLANEASTLTGDEFSTISMQLEELENQLLQQLEQWETLAKKQEELRTT